ncbi:MAG: phosphate ABC transporter substrate-binding protein PstS [Candidatus Abyssubacteria bacterium]
MKKILVLGLALALLTAVSVRAEEITINGAGATFPYPVYSQWAYKYNKLTGMKLNYQSIGSGGGIAQIKAKTVDFGASDAPLEPKELDDAGLLQFPMVIGGVVPVINVPGIESGQLRLTSDVLAEIFLGNITKWNDPAIAANNKDMNLPATAITVVHRADGSGTTWIFTDYLKKVSQKWSTQVGAGKAVAWPVGIGGKGNEGVAVYVQRVAGSIGYVEYAYALQNKMTYVLLKNRDGNYVEPVMETFQAAAANADWKNAPNFHVVLTDQPGAKSWPITGASFILVYEKQQDAKRAKAMLSFFDWCYRHGGDIARELHYVPMPMNVVELVEATWSAKMSANGKALWP